MTTATLLMSGRAKIIMAITRNDNCLVKKFLGDLQAVDRKKIIRRIKDTADNGPHPSREQFRVIENGLFEIKCHQVRILGFFEKDNVMLLSHGCIKKKDDLDTQDIIKAKMLFKEYQVTLGQEGR